MISFLHINSTELRELHEKRANDDEEKKPETTTEIPSSTIM